MEGKERNRNLVRDLLALLVVGDLRTLSSSFDFLRRERVREAASAKAGTFPGHVEMLVNPVYHALGVAMEWYTRRRVRRDLRGEEERAQKMG